MSLLPPINSYVTLAEADAYLADSIRAATTWAALDTATKEAALKTAHRLLERMSWEGEKLEGHFTSRAAVPSSPAGTDYAASDVLTLGATPVDEDLRALITVATVSGGVPQTITQEHAGLYDAAPATPAATAVVSATNSPTGFVVDLTNEAFTAQWPRSTHPTEIPDDIKHAQIEYAYELSQDPSIETGRVGVQNTKRVKAGSVEVENFRPSEGKTAPSVVLQLIADYLESGSTSGVSSGGLYSYPNASSTFDDDYDLDTPLR